MNIYLDIDGVLLADMATPAKHADEFLQTVLTKYPDNTYWLTTHVWNGENMIDQTLAPYLKPETQALLGCIKPTEWGQAKTDAIDFSQPFLWFDDDLYDDERTALGQHSKLSSRIEVDLHKNPEQLKELVSLL
ncbi:MAG: hypothetical protein U5K77_02475 [Candidatus Saccharibacteria bacterium]|nr:hypothetical protein [Candidatus Saccharibacteria bacterium]